MNQTGAPPTPYLLDFYPLQGEEHTRIAPFFANLKEGRFTTTKCRGCGAVHWQPRAVCPECLKDALDWIDLPIEGTVYAHTALLKGAPMGMEEGFVIGAVELQVEGKPLRILTRIDGATEDELAIGDKVRFKTVELPDGRVFFRFQAVK